MRALIADDEPNLAFDLQRRLQLLWPELEIVAVVHDGLSARQNLLQLAPDIAFLDIRMPGISGLEAARAAPTSCRIVFVTAFDDQAVAAFELAAADYLLKPVADDRLAGCVERLRREPSFATTMLLSKLEDLMPTAMQGALQGQQYLRWLRVQQGRKMQLLAVDEVCYFQSADKYTTAITVEREHLLRTPLKTLLPQLCPDEFWQIHRSIVIRVAEIEAARRTERGQIELILRNRSERLPVSRSFSHLFRQM
jgi:DNA-binding LytR/AlgR family response regulator